MPIIMIAGILFSRLVGIVVCSKLVNSMRNNHALNVKKQMFLWFAGVRGAMAFALSIKSLDEYPEAGKVFLILTLFTTSFTVCE